tara:strand:- start:421 stop:648 length:228 start_codon:yes stop_codon:yes gene_type:complete
MIQDFISLGGYGQFIWPAFMFTFLSLYILYFKSMKEFKKQEKLFFNSYKEIKSVKITVDKKKEAAQEPLYNNPVN